jgi:outer membrane protein TolC
VLAAPRVLALVSEESLYEEARENRVEVKALDETLRSLDGSRKTVKAGYWPRLDVFANVYGQNPNQRYFGLPPAWRSSWDAGVQLSWTMNDALATRPQVAQLDARLLEAEETRTQILDGLRLEVTQAEAAARDADLAIETTEEQVRSSEESYRVRRELFRASRSTSAELVDAETDLMRSRLDALNARIDARIARVNLDHALGRPMTATKP